jgi:4,5-DOPA dioxygenase extradiol
MERKHFIKALAALPFMTTAMKLDALARMAAPFERTPKMPVLFLGHGSPMNAIEDNEFSRGWQAVGKTLPKPNAILCISAHWETNGTYVTAMERPKTIHDFGGFPKQLFEVEYPAPGSPSLAAETKKIVTKTNIGLDDSWGLDHGAWSVIKHLYPAADVPVIQMSLDYRKPAAYHYELAKELASLREKGILIVGSGNIVHNLGIIAWDKVKEPEYGYDWAIHANESLKKLIITDNHQQLANYQSLGKEIALAAPSPDHFLPILYALALKSEKEEVSIFNDKLVMGSISMASFKIS